MIFPYLFGLLSCRKSPVTWTLFFLNAFVFLFTSLTLQKTQDRLEKVFNDKYFIETQGRFFAQWILKKQNIFNSFYQKLSLQAMNGDKNHLKLLGHMAFRDVNFLQTENNYFFDGDQVAYEVWRKEIKKIGLIHDTHPNVMMGINHHHLSARYWITYQFAHSGVVHFIFNMIFLFVFGCYLESKWGGLFVLIAYLSSGVIGAGIFILLNGVTAIPLIGASASISGLMAAACVLSGRTSMRCFYWLFIPVRGYSGFVQIPAWCVFFLWFSADLAGYLSSLADLGGVAHAAHLGGQLSGGVIAVALILTKKYTPFIESSIGFIRKLL